MISFLLIVTLQVFKIRKRERKIIKVDSKRSNLSFDPLENIDFLGNHKQSNIA